MTKPSLATEYLSLLVLLIILVRYYGYEWKVALNAKRRLFLYCLASAMVSTLLNIVTVLLPRCISPPLIWLGILLNTCYFLSALVSCFLYAWFLFVLTLEHVYDPHCTNRAKTALTVLAVLACVIILMNFFTGCLFYYDAAGQYQRGPLNRTVFFFPLAELALLFTCYRKNRSRVTNSMVYVMRTLPYLVILMCLCQILLPDFLLNSALSAVISLVLFISFQTHTNDRDSLTGIRNRNNFMTEMSLRLSSHQPIHIIAVSLISFADVNLRYGHTFGDSILYEVARYLDKLYPDGRAFRPSNMIFALTLPWTTQEEADERVRTIQARMAEPWVLGSIRCQLISCTVDMHCRSQNGDTLDKLVEQLEYALVKAKKERSHVRFDSDMARQMHRKKELIHIMQRSIQEHRFQVWYQPIYCCHRDAFCSAEALLRLKDYDGNLIPPDVFIPLAEESGFIGELTWIVLEEVCRLLSSGRVPTLNSISVNISMQQFLDPDLASRIQTYLDRYRLPPERLKLEITERFLLHDIQYTRRQLKELKAIGIEIYMDDFGTGYSNLSSVLDHPFNFIKLDRSLVVHVPEDRRATLMVKTLLDLFHSLDRRVVVEGAETAEQAACLRQAGADMIQGFYYAKPMPQEELTAFLSGRS